MDVLRLIASSLNNSISENTTADRLNQARSTKISMAISRKYKHINVDIHKPT